MVVASLAGQGRRVKAVPGHLHAFSLTDYNIRLAYLIIYDCSFGVFLNDDVRGR